MARDTMRIMPLPANAPSKDPAATTAAAASSMVFGPNFLASAPVGRARMMPTNVKMDMSHDAELASISMLAMMSPMTTGTLYCTVAIAVPNRSMTIAINIQLPYFFSASISNSLIFVLRRSGRLQAAANPTPTSRESNVAQCQQRHHNSEPVPRRAYSCFSKQSETSRKCDLSTL